MTFPGFGRRRGTGYKPFLRWLCYFLILLLFFMVMSGGFFRKWQPILIIPLAIAVAMREREFGSAIFGVFCGFMLDIACGNLFGMSSVWLMPCALASSLLVMHLMRPNFINHVWMSAATCLIMGFMEYFFNYRLWGFSNSGIILRNYIIPSYAFAVLFSPAVYFLVKVVYVKFGDGEPERCGEIEERDIDEGGRL